MMAREAGVSTMEMFFDCNPELKLEEGLIWRVYRSHFDMLAGLPTITALDVLGVLCYQELRAQGRRRDH